MCEWNCVLGVVNSEHWHMNSKLHGFKIKKNVLFLLNTVTSRNFILTLEKCLQFHKQQKNWEIPVII